MDDAPILRVRDLVTTFRTEGSPADTRRRVFRAVDEVSFDVPRGATVALVGESGCGKTVTALSILRLVASPPGRIESGAIELEGRDLLGLSEREIRAVRGNLVSMIFQEPMTSLNPVYAVGWQIAEGYRIHRKKSRREARERATELLRLVGIPEPETTVDAYPHRLSGGQRQRVMIAMALACEPRLLVADEPTTALDVTIQAQILALLAELQQKLSMSILLITHDLGVVAEHASFVVVMYAGRVIERASVRQLFARPMHPYTRGLLESIPRPDAQRGKGAPRRLRAIEGMVPDLRALPAGCHFADRCPMRIDKCTREEPPLLQVAPGRDSRCWRADEVSP
jgi:peptide/nickel transport system ATP-binding protein